MGTTGFRGARFFWMEFMHHIQRLAAAILGQVESGKNLTDALTQTLKSVPHLQSSDRAALQNICYGSIRHLGTLKFWLRKLVPRPLSELVVEHTLLVALYQLQFTRAAEHAIVNGAVNAIAEIAKGRFKGLANGVLRNFLRQRTGLLADAKHDRVAELNHPEWWINALQKAYPGEWQSVIEASNNHPPMTLRVNLRHLSVEAYLAKLQAEGLVATHVAEAAIMLDKPVNVSVLPGFEQGDVSVQDWGAQQAAHLLDIQSGQRVLDACAAPGGKTCHILELADVELTALDVDSLRLKRVQENLDRLALQAKLLTADAADSSDWWDGVLFDRILADVPCSATGVVRRHPDIKWLRRENDFSGFARQQAMMIDTLWKLLASGGKMLYATCSIFPEENSEQLHAFLARHPDATCLNQKQLLPCERHDGFYYALLEKH